MGGASSLSLWSSRSLSLWSSRLISPTQLYLSAEGRQFDSLRLDFENTMHWAIHLTTTHKIILTNVRPFTILPTYSRIAGYPTGFPPRTTTHKIILTYVRPFTILPTYSRIAGYPMGFPPRTIHYLIINEIYKSLYPKKTK